MSELLMALFCTGCFVLGMVVGILRTLRHKGYKEGYSDGYEAADTDNHIKEWFFRGYECALHIITEECAANHIADIQIEEE